MSYEMYVGHIGRVMAMVFCIDRAGGATNPMLNMLVREIRDLAARSVVPVIMNAADIAHDKGKAPEDVDKAVTTLLDSLSRMFESALQLGGKEAEKYKKCYDYLMAPIVSAVEAPPPSEKVY